MPYMAKRHKEFSVCKAAWHACTCRTVQEREQDYSKARARIFGAQQSPDASMSPSHSPQIHDNAMRGMMNGSRPQNVGPMGGRGRGPPGRVDPSRKAVFRNREQDLQDPDYHRNNRYRCCHIPFESCVCTVARPQRHKLLKRADFVSNFTISHKAADHL